MKKAICLFLILLFALSTVSCIVDEPDKDWETPNNQNKPTTDLGDDNSSFGTDLEDTGIFDGYFEEETQDVTILCASGTENAYRIEDGTIYFSSVKEDSVYSISGQFKGNIIIDIGDEYKFDLEMLDFSLVSENVNPITVLSGSKVSLTAKNQYKSYIYDNREAIDSTDETLYSGAIYSLVDLEICGKGELNVISKNNNGIHTKDDLEIKNLTLTVSCVDNSLKGNDSVTIESGNLTLISTQGDGIKTTNSSISEKGNQRGTVSVLGGSHTIYAACDGIDAAYNVIIDNENTVLNIYTDKYSNYSDEVTDTSEGVYYIRFSQNSYFYSVKYYNSDEDYLWVDATYHSKVSGGRSTYYYYSLPKLTEYEKMQFFIYTSEMEQGQDAEYYLATELLTPNDAYDTLALTSRGYQWGYNWTNYTTQIQGGGFGGMGGPGGMGGGNTEKSDYSTK
ncbi:MAG: carbohydrate-binding domain-containing protein, partial [Clostridia bacterium]|nr:carbohydrate-binding domain-containing protein [Clostridia bacterium]